MADIKGLVSRVDAELWALGEKHRKAQAEQVQAYQEQQKRPQQLGQVFDRLREMVEGPVAGDCFPRFAAGATLERDGKTHYFVGEETRRFREATGGCVEVSRPSTEIIHEDGPDRRE